MNIETIKIKIADRAAESRFSGAVAIRSADDRVTHQAAFGLRDVQNQLSNEPNTKFGIASGTKFFTALAIGKLIDQKMLTLDSTIKNLFETEQPFIDESATVRQLLCHTSGIYDYLDEEVITDFDAVRFEIPWYELKNPSDYLPLFQGHSPKFKPGARFSYSNGGFVYLAVIVEKLSGLLYKEFVESEILKPAGMIDSGFFAFNQLPENTANGYLSDGITTNIYGIPIRGGGDGGMFTTAADMDRCWRYFLDRQILSASLTDEFLTTQVEYEHQRGYGLGIWKDLAQNHLYLVGGDAGVGFHSRYIPENDVVFSILANQTDGGGDVLKELLALI